MELYTSSKTSEVYTPHRRWAYAVGCHCDNGMIRDMRFRDWMTRAPVRTPSDFAS